MEWSTVKVAVTAPALPSVTAGASAMLIEGVPGGIGVSKKEANETFYLDLFGNSGNSLFTKNRGLGTILNDD